MLLRVRRRRRTSVGAAALDTHLTRPTSQPPALDVPLPSPCDLFGQRSFLKMPQMESGDCQTRQSHEPQLEMWCRHKFFFFPHLLALLRAGPAKISSRLLSMETSAERKLLAFSCGRLPTDRQTDH